MAGNRPAKIGKYDVIDVIGRGGMGVVYKGTDPYLDRLVAIKMMTGSFADHPDQLKRFFREAQSTASLQHPNIVTVYELGDHGGNPYLVMEYLDGESLDSIISGRRQLSFVEKINLMGEVCQGLSYAHQRGVVHRDIKPANIMVCKGGGVKIVDFGIAHFGDKNVTRTGQIVGSINYMSPEQVNGRPVDARTDIFSTGIVLYQLFTYALPFEGENTASTLLKIIHEPPPPLKNFLASYPPELETIIHRALAKDRNERYTSADEFALDLGQLQGQLKQELINRYLQEATLLIEKNDLHRAKGQLLQVLKIDRQHTDASQLLREIQQKIQRQEISEEVRQLRSQAEEAYAQEQFETALGCIDRALTLDKNNADLQQLRLTVKAAELRAQKLQRAVRLAESAHQGGDLDSAKQAIEEALEIAPNNTHAKTLQRAIQRDWVERSRQRQVENYLEQARKEITSRKFTAALELLRQAEALDPAAPQIQALIESAVAAKEQEYRRRELEAINREIEEALNRDDYQAASAKADEGLKNFPEERSLLKLRTLAEKQRQIAERKQFVDEQLAQARSLLEQGRSEELVSRLEAALAKAGGEPRLQSLLLIVRENVARERLERRKTEYLQKAKEALRRKEHEEALRILEVARTELQDAGEIEDLLQFAKEEAANEKRRRAADAAADNAHRLIAEQEYERAIQLLEETLQETADEELRIILGEARRAALDYEKKLETVLGTASKLMEARKATEAVKLLDAQPASFSRRIAFQRLLESARREADRLRQIEETINRSQEFTAREDYSSAVSLLEQCRRALGNTPELEQQLAQVQQKRSETASTEVQKALSDARMLLNAAEYRAALDRLALVSQRLPFVTQAVKSQYETVRQQASSGLAYHRRLEIERHMAAGEFTGAAELLRQTLTEFPGHRDLSDLERVLQQESARKSDAKAKLAEAQKLLERAAWKDAAELLKKAFAAARRVPPLREAVVKAFVQGAQAAVETDWRAAESLLAQAGELQPNDPRPSALLARIAERKQEEAVSQCLEQAKRAHAVGDLGGVLRELARGLSTYPNDSSLKDFQEIIRAQIREQEEKAQRERERLEKQAFLYQVSQRAEQEPRLDHRAHILEDALARYPAEPMLERQLNQVRELWKRVSELANEARVREDAKHYQEALKRWEALRTIYAQYPDLGRNIERVRKLHEDERVASKAAWIRKLEITLVSGDLEQAGALLRQAAQEFPAERELATLESKIQEALKLRTKAQKLLASAEKAFGKSQWKKGAESLKRGCDAAPQDPVIRRAAIGQLVLAFDSALTADWPSASAILLRVEELRPDSSLLKTLGERLEGRKREQELARAGELQLKLERERARQRESDREQELRQKQQQLEKQRREEETRLWREQQETQLELEQTQELSATRPLETPPAPATSTSQLFSRSSTAPEPTVEDAEPSEQSRALGVTIAPAPSTKRPPQLIISRLARSMPRTTMAVSGILIVALAAILWWIRSLPSPVPLGIMTTPAGASIRINNTNQSCVTPNCHIHLAPGNYEIEAQLQGYQTVRRSISVITPGPSSVAIALIPLADQNETEQAQRTPESQKTELGQYGQLDIRGAPAGAQIFVDGTPRGTTTSRGTFSAEVSPGEHQIKIVAKNETPSITTRQFSSGSRVELSRPDFKGPASSPAGPELRREDFDWLHVKDSHSSQDVNSYLKRYPKGIHRAEAESKLEDLYWTQAKQSNTLAAVREYLDRYPRGRYADEARGAIAAIDWQAVEHTTHPAALEDFLSRYPSGPYHDRAAAMADDLRWSQTARDLASLRTYLQRFPSGRHADEARADLDRVEAQDWERVRATSQQTEIKEFLSKYPSGSHAAEAKSRLQDLAWAQTNREDVAALQEYLNSFPTGRHAGEASHRVDDILWDKLDKKDRGSLLAFISHHSNSTHGREAQAILDQMALQERALQKTLDLFNAAFEHQQPRELKEIWPGATDRYLEALRPPAGYRVVLRLQVSAEPILAGDTAQVPCELISETTVPGGQTKQSTKPVKVSLYKSGDRWLINDPFGQ